MINPATYYMCLLYVIFGLGALAALLFVFLIVTKRD